MEISDTGSIPYALSGQGFGLDRIVSEGYTHGRCALHTYPEIEEAATMKTDIRIIRKDEQSTGTWAGGTTTQLAIWPPEADYKRRDFLWRISSARVDLEESTFTALPGIHRLIMILEGKVHLVHEDHHEAFLDAFDQDSFEGGWTTLSRGRCVDFNLMTAEGCNGRIEALKPPVAEISVLRGVTEAFYSLTRGLKMIVREGGEVFEATLDREDFAMLRQEDAADEVKISLIPLEKNAVAAIRATVRG